MKYYLVKTNNPIILVDKTVVVELTKEELEKLTSIQIACNKKLQPVNNACKKIRKVLEND